MFGGNKKNCYTLLLEQSGDITPVQSEKRGTKVYYSVNKEEHAYPITLETRLRFNGKPAWFVPEGKGEPVDVMLEKFQTAMSARTVDDLIQDNSMEQFLTFARSFGKALAQNWAIIIMIGITILLVLWTQNNVDGTHKTVNQIWEQVRPTPTYSPPVNH